MHLQIHVLYLFNISEYKAMLIQLLIYHINIDVFVYVCIYIYKHCTKASLHSDTVEDLIRISVEGSSLKMLMLERVWPAGLAKDKDQEDQTTGVGHLRGM